MSLESTIHLTNMAIGMTSGAIAYLNRGDWEFDPTKGRNVPATDFEPEGKCRLVDKYYYSNFMNALRRGFSKKIAEKFPRYEGLSPLVDHAAGSVGIIALFGGIFGLIKEYTGLSGSEIDPYYVSTALWYIHQMLWEAKTYLHGKRKWSKNDFAQIATDLITPALYLYALHQVIEKIK